MRPKTEPVLSHPLRKLTALQNCWRAACSETYRNFVSKWWGGNKKKRAAILNWNFKWEKSLDYGFWYRLNPFISISKIFPVPFTSWNKRKIRDGTAPSKKTTPEISQDFRWIVFEYLITNDSKNSWEIELNQVLILLSDILLCCKLQGRVTHS